mmetsp:Transcript_32397/g.70736  ORF Transcript_32397/g.70736 Transcript_32397/m.70736 type:complete len:472 (-) Transcript_32397:175-1590(-)|eukprot:CAMPEP_0118934460 /NCGR_PEP_ID=MMETSP1169-20130426/13836_1 /TAXON_ID=36882 /ORGANISM="Pyramimonas obovata, Strain CCMP722" /LENGTH=471 /DNA_ID=CAMNT_0006877365 /DNA_START=96 /DNA_END=1511 /DNA_ORIENTATION=+
MCKEGTVTTTLGALPKAALSKGNVNVTWEELAQHNTSEDLWVAIRGKVYDLTSYQQRHPGGKHFLQLGAGRDVTHLFEAYHPLSVLDSNILDKFEIGTLKTQEYHTYPPMSPFHRTLKKRVYDYLNSRKVDAQYTVWGVQLFRVALLVGAVFGFYALSALAPVVLPEPLATCTPLHLLFATLAGAARALVGLHTMHDSSHGACGNKPGLWTICGVLSNDFANGSSYYGWLHQHILGHHQYCNSIGVDPDVRPFPFRLGGHQEWRWYHRYQFIWGPLVYSLLSVLHRIEDFTFISEQKWDTIRMAPFTHEHKVYFWSGKAFFFFWQLVLPGLLGVPFWHMLMVHAVAEAVGSWYLAISFQANHVAEETEFQPIDSAGHCKQDWAEMQARTTQDYGHGSLLTFYLTGGLNYQVVHHLLPGVSQLHYKDIQPIVKQTCEEFGVKYNHMPSFAAAVSSHLRHLYQMGLPPKAKAN